MARLMHSSEPDVRTRLQDFGLSIEELHQVARAAYVAKADCSPLHPPTFPGTAAWATAVLAFRDMKLPEGWRAADPGNFSVTINDAGQFFVVIATGDDDAGRAHGREPTTKSTKGMKTEAAVAANRQMSLFPAEIPSEVLAESHLSKFKAWVLLLNIDGTTVYIELSSPSGMEKGKIVEWDERIIVPPLTLGLAGGDNSPGNGPISGVFAPDVDVDVQRIG
jgi:hypothetical protein